MLNNKFIQDEKKLQESLNKLYTEKKESKTKIKRSEIDEKIKKKVNSLKKMRDKESKEAERILQQAIKINLSNTTREIINQQFNLISDTKDRITQKVSQDFKTDIKNGLLRGDRVLRTYKKTNPLLIRGRTLQFYRKGNDILIKWYGGVTFKCIIGQRKNNNHELYILLNKILENDSKVCDSSITIGRKLILNLSVALTGFEEDIPTVKGRVLGVNFGMKVPIYMSLNDKPHVQKSVGNLNDLLKLRVQLYKRKKKMKNLIIKSIGDKAEKLKVLNRFKEKEKNILTTYNHYLSYNIVQFAKENQVGQINIEYLPLVKTKNKALKSWPYYQLQQFIEYKAKRKKIEVKYINAYLLNKKCSNCGKDTTHQSNSNNIFNCKKCQYRAPLDSNISRNIALCTEYISIRKE
ncbi:transposase [Bacillus toyonensis]|uniref:transposase n=1 Tax=Bacillus toyonensis TaxID=155322 RepID=UPI0020D2376B|nr:transposase [Bacillus toyonensis]